MRKEPAQLGCDKPGIVNPKKLVRKKRRAKVTTWEGWALAFERVSPVLYESRARAEEDWPFAPSSRLMRVVATLREVRP